jgi:hypothetical protein
MQRAAGAAAARQPRRTEQRVQLTKDAPGPVETRELNETRSEVPHGYRSSSTSW